MLISAQEERTGRKPAEEKFQVPHLVSSFSVGYKVEAST